MRRLDLRPDTKPGASPTAGLLDPRIPKYRVLRDGTPYLRIYNFNSRYRDALEAILDERDAKLRAAKCIVIDVRSNPGPIQSTRRTALRKPISRAHSQL